MESVNVPVCGYFCGIEWDFSMFSEGLSGFAPLRGPINVGNALRKIRNGPFFLGIQTFSSFMDLAKNFGPKFVTVLFCNAFPKVSWVSAKMSAAKKVLEKTGRGRGTSVCWNCCREL